MPMKKKNRCTRDINHYIGNHQRKDGYILTVVSPGSHMTSGLVIPTFIRTWRGHIKAIQAHRGQLEVK
jgi:hypothetical protein